MKASTLLIAALALSAATPVFAAHGHRYNNVYERLEEQRTRIDQGIESGALTRREAARLEDENRRIRRLAYELREDGRLSRRDRRVLDEELDRADKHIYRLKHNDEYRHRDREHPHRHYWKPAPQYDYRW